MFCVTIFLKVVCEDQYRSKCSSIWQCNIILCSLMVEELARWKAALSQKATDLQEALKRVLEERGKARESLLNTYRYADRVSTDTSLCCICNDWCTNAWSIAHRNLSVLRESFDHTYSISHKPDLASTNILDLAAGTTRLSEGLRHTLLGGSNTRARAEPDFTGLSMSTCAEKAAENVSRLLLLTVIILVKAFSILTITSMSM
jgi:hypothetical protein